jgi:hypothetical protein
MEFAFKFEEGGPSSIPSDGDSRTSADAPGTSPERIELVGLFDYQPAAPSLPALVVEGVYEGGAQVWEATTFLLAFLRDERGGAEALSAARCVADLGCGAGRLACAALEACAPCGGGGGGGGALRSLLMTDLNAQVLRSVAAPAVRDELARQAQQGRVALASAPAQHPVHVELVAGSWSAILSSLSSPVAGQRLLRASGADLVLSAETLYRPAELPSLCALIHALLAPRGEALLATKRFYFGRDLGGGTAALIAAAEAHGRLRAVVVRSKEDGVSMNLDIIRVTHEGFAD